MIGAEHFASSAPPWVLLSTCDVGTLRTAVHRASPSLAFIPVSGDRCPTKAQLFDEFARALRFPEYFGHNWDAFDECVNDLDWLDAPGGVIAITKAERLLADDEHDYTTFIGILPGAGREWAAPSDGRVARPFHVVLLVSSAAELPRRDWGVGQASFDAVPR